MEYLTDSTISDAIVATISVAMAITIFLYYTTKETNEKCQTDQKNYKLREGLWHFGVFVHPKVLQSRLQTRRRLWIISHLFQLQTEKIYLFILWQTIPWVYLIIFLIIIVRRSLKELYFVVESDYVCADYVLFSVYFDFPLSIPYSLVTVLRSVKRYCNVNEFTKIIPIR